MKYSSYKYLFDFKNYQNSFTESLVERIYASVYSDQEPDTKYYAADIKSNLFQGCVKDRYCIVIICPVEDGNSKPARQVSRRIPATGVVRQMVSQRISNPLSSSSQKVDQIQNAKAQKRTVVFKRNGRLYCRGIETLFSLHGKYKYGVQQLQG